MMRDKPGFATSAVHAGREPKQVHGAISTPIYATASFELEDVDHSKSGYRYARTSNPTRTALEHCAATLEGAKHALAVASGMAAADLALKTCCKAGDHILVPNDVFSATYRLIHQAFEGWGIECSAVDQTDLDAVKAAIRPNTTVVWTESPTNPLLKIVDIAGLCEIAHSAGAKVIADNALATSYLQRPLDLGADIVAYSTKYLAGHTDLINGIAATNDNELFERMRFLENAAGCIPSPFDCWLTIRGAKTLALRMERQCDSAEVIAEFLQNDIRVAKVHYPGMPTHPNHKVAAEQMKRFGGVVGIELAGGERSAINACNQTEIFCLAESFGGVESLIQLPAEMTHVDVPPAAEPIPKNFVRLSIGIEDVDDLIADLDSALS